MDLRSACLATARLYREQAEHEPNRREMLLAEAEKWMQKAETRLRVLVCIEGRSQSFPEPNGPDTRRVA